MHCGETMFTKKEIEQLLKDQGYNPEMLEFHEELRRRFMPVDGIPGCWVEV